jgi:hypothetical protein
MNDKTGNGASNGQFKLTCPCCGSRVSSRKPDKR